MIKLSYTNEEATFDHWIMWRLVSAYAVSLFPFSHTFKFMLKFYNYDSETVQTLVRREFSVHRKLALRDYVNIFMPTKPRWLWYCHRIYREITSFIILRGSFPKFEDKFCFLISYNIVGVFLCYTMMCQSCTTFCQLKRNLQLFHNGTPCIYDTLWRSNDVFCIVLTF